MPQRTVVSRSLSSLVANPSFRLIEDTDAAIRGIATIEMAGNAELTLGQKAVFAALNLARRHVFDADRSHSAELTILQPGVDAVVADVEHRH